MKRTIILLIATLFICNSAMAETKAPFGYDLSKDIHRSSGGSASPTNNNAAATQTTNKKHPEIKYYGNETEAEWLTDKTYCANASLSSAIEKYKRRNYTGSLQELITLTKKDSSNPLLYYYLGMNYTQTGNKDQAIKAYEKVMKLNSNPMLSNYALRGRNCLVQGETCNGNTPTSSDQDVYDDFIRAPYGNGLSPEINDEIRKKQIERLQKNINTNNDLNVDDLRKMRELDRGSELPTEDKVAVSDEDILNAIKVLRDAGITLSVNAPQYMPNDEYAQLSMLLGNNNNNYNNNTMMNMLPYMLSQNSGKNIDPQLLQSMMMNSMIPDFTFNDKKD